MHIGFVAANGRVGSLTLLQFCREYAAKRADGDDLRVTLVSPTSSPSKGHAILRDIRQAMPPGSKPFDAISTDQYTDLRNADMVVVLASALPTQERIDSLVARGMEHRTALSCVNCEVIENISQKLQINAPKAHVLMVTNQADMMAAIARKRLPLAKVIGFGGFVDSRRLRGWADEHAEAAGIGAAEKANIQKIHMVGYHNNDMRPLGSTISGLPSIDNDVLETLVDQTRNDGYEMTMMLADRAHSSSESSSPWMTPADALATTIAAFTGLREPLVESFNSVLTGAVAAHYGVASGTGLSVPMRVSKGAFEVVVDFPVSDDERAYFAAAAQRLDEGLAEVMATRPARISTLSREKAAPAPGHAAAVA